MANTRVTTPEMRARIMEAVRDNQASVAEVAAQFGIGENTVRRVLAAAGVKPTCKPPRPPVAAKKRTPAKPRTRDRVKAYVLKVTEDTGSAPTQRQVAAALGIATGTAAYHLQGLAVDGEIDPPSGRGATGGADERVLAHVIRQATEFGRPLTVRDVAQHLQISEDAVRKHVADLDEEGHLNWGPGHPRRLITPRGTLFHNDCSALLDLAQQGHIPAPVRPQVLALAAAVVLLPRGVRSPYKRTAVAHAVRHLEHRYGRPIAAVEVGDLLGWPKTTTHKALHAAAASGDVHHDEDGYTSPLPDLVYANALHLRREVQRGWPADTRPGVTRVLGRVLG